MLALLVGLLLAVADAAVDAARRTDAAPDAAPDAGAPDAAVPDAGVPDAGPPDAAPPDAAPPPPAAPAEGRGRLALRLSERGTRAPVAGAFVQIVPLDPKNAALGTIDLATDETGRLDADLPPGRYKLGAYPADQAEVIREVTITRGRTTTLVLLAAPIWRQEEVVTIVEKVETPSAVRRELPVEQLQRLPGTQGDALKVVQNLPGAARVPFGGGGLVLRGTSPRDSKAFIDGIEIPQLFHFGGIVSVYNSDMLSSIELYPGGFDARFGRTQGGIVEVYSRSPRDDTYHGVLDVNFIDTTALAEGPVAGGAFAVAVRRSYVDAILAVALPERPNFDLLVAPRYYDYQARHDRPLAGGRFALYVFGSDDRLEFLRSSPLGLDSAERGRFLNQTLFHRVVAKHELESAGRTVRSMVATGFDQIKLQFGERGSEQRRVPLLARTDARLRLRPGLDLSGGADLQGGWWTFDTTRPPSLGQGGQRDPTQPVADVTQRADHPFFNGALHAGAHWKARPWLELLPTARVDYFHLSREVVVDPRLVVREPLGAALTLRQNVGLYHQPPTDVDLDPVFGNPELESSYAVQVGAGGTWRPNPLVKVELDAFYNELFRLPVPTALGPNSARAGSRNRAASTAGAELFAPAVGLQGYQTGEGRGRSYGAELLLRGETSRLFGWIAYTIMRAERQDAPGEAFRPFSFDQTHILTVLASYKLDRGYRLGGRFRLVSGNPYTPVEESFFDADANRYVPVVARPNSGRLPAFHALDVRFDKEWVFDTWTLGVYLDVQNVYNHESVEAVRYAFDYAQRTDITGTPVLPSFGIKGSF